MTDSTRLDAALQEQQDSDGAWYRSPLALVAAMILFLGALAIVVLAVTGGGDDDGSTQVADVAGGGEPIVFGGPAVPESDAVAIDGDPLPFGGADDDPAVGMLAPQITGTSLANGNSITLGPGKARVIGFFAHWCGHCQRELPEVTQWLTENRLPPNTEFIAISTAVDEGNGNYPPSEWFTEVGFSSPVVVDDADDTLLATFGFTGFPAFIAVDASGVVVARATGNIGTSGLADLFDNFAS